MSTPVGFRDLKDQRLVSRMSRGDDRALGELYDRYGELCFSHAVAVTREGADAQEVVAAVFHQLWENADSFDRTRGSVRAWLATATRTRSMDLVRARGRAIRRVERAAREEGEGIAPFSGRAPVRPDDAAEKAELRDMVDEALGQLPVPQREAMELWYLMGLSHAEIAEEVQEPLGTVKSRLRTALSRLRDSLGPLLGEVSR